MILQAFDDDVVYMTIVVKTVGHLMHDAMTTNSFLR